MRENEVEENVKLRFIGQQAGFFSVNKSVRDYLLERSRADTARTFSKSPAALGSDSEG